MKQILVCIPVCLALLGCSSHPNADDIKLGLARGIATDFNMSTKYGAIPTKDIHVKIDECHEPSDSDILGFPNMPASAKSKTRVCHVVVQDLKIRVLVTDTSGGSSKPSWIAYPLKDSGSTTEEIANAQRLF